MTYENNRANRFELSGHQVLLNIQSSKIGYSYPRIFIEEAPDRHINLDLCLGAAFKMPEEDWADWISDCEEITQEEAREYLKPYIKWDVFEQVLANM